MLALLFLVNTSFAHPINHNHQYHHSHHRSCDHVRLGNIVWINGHYNFGHWVDGHWTIAIRPKRHGNCHKHMGGNIHCGSH